MKSGFFFCLLPACMGCREAPGTRRLKDKKAICFQQMASLLEGTAKVDVFQGQIKPPRSGGPKPEPRDSILI